MASRPGSIHSGLQVLFSLSLALSLSLYRSISLCLTLSLSLSLSLSLERERERERARERERERERENAHSLLSQRLFRKREGTLGKTQRIFSKKSRTAGFEPVCELQKKKKRTAQNCSGSTVCMFQNLVSKPLYLSKQNAGRAQISSALHRPFITTIHSISAKIVSSSTLH